MPIQFSRLPEHIRISIVQKQYIHDFIIFQKSSRDSYLIARNVKTRFSYHVRDEIFFRLTNEGKLSLSLSSCHKHETSGMDIPIRFHASMLILKDQTTQELCELITKFTLFTGSSFNEIYLAQCNCSLEQLSSLLCASQAIGFLCMGTMSSDFVRMSALHHLELVNLGNCFLNNQELMSLKIRNLEVWGTDVTSAGINSYLKEWMNGEREIDKFTVTSINQLQMHDIFDGIPHSAWTINEVLHYCIENKKKSRFFVSLCAQNTEFAMRQCEEMNWKMQIKVR